MSTYKSPFPTNFLGVDLYYSGAWQSIGSDLERSGVSLSHGVRSEGGKADASSLSFTVTNSGGKYSPRNPQSALYGLVGRNTPVRAHVSLGAPWLDLEATGARATTPDNANLDITGDIDVRWWGFRDSWNESADLISKWASAGNNKSFLFRANANGTISFVWSNDGSATLTATSDTPIPSWAGEIALRAVVDVNNGASGRTITFYYAGTLSTAVAPDAANWTQLGDPVVTAGTTSIFAGTAVLTLGKNADTVTTDSPQRVYGWSVRNGITGAQATRSQALVSDKTAGVTSFTDSQSQTWTVTNGTVSNKHVLASCEVAEWPVDWNTKGAPSVMTDVQASGVTRRLGQGAQAVESVLYRAISASNEGVIAYWPMEDGSDSTSFGAAIGTRSMGRSSAITPAAYSAFRGSGPIPTISTGRARGVVPSYSNTGEVQVRWVQWTPGAGVAGEQTIMRTEFTGGTIAYIDLKVRADGDFGVFGYDFDGAELSGSTFVNGGGIEGKSLRVSVEYNQNSAKVFWRFSFLQAFEVLGETYGQDFTFDHTLGRASNVIINPSSTDFPDVAIGHVTVGTEITQLFDGVEGDILIGHIGETAGDRIERLVEENGTVSVSVRGSTTAQMGEQQEETLLDLLEESAEADGGILHDDARSLGLRYRSLHSMTDQPAVTIPYQDNLVIPFDTTDDDGLTRNRVTVTRPNGSRITSEVTEGPMSVQAPPNGVGLYDESVTLNLYDDDLVTRAASWRSHVGTWDESRYPTLGVDLAHPYFLANPVLTRQLLSLTPGDRLVITDPPAWLPPMSVEVIVRGVSASIGTHNLRLQWSCVPARPYRTAYWNAGHRYSGEGTEISAALAAYGSSALVLTGAAGSYATTPDASALDITGDIDIRVRAALDDWTPSATQTLVGKWTASGSQRSYALSVTTTGLLRLTWTTGGVTTLTMDSTVAPTVSNGAALWVRAALDVNNGASGRTATFYTSPDGSNWTQLGSSVVVAGTTSIFSGSAPVLIGALDAGLSNRAVGKISAVEIRNSAGSLVASPVFNAQAAGTTSFTDANSRTWTVSSPASIATVTNTVFTDVVQLDTPTGVSWTHADGNYDIVVGGEIMTVTAVTGNTMTVNRSVNGVQKTHAIGAAVALASPSYYAR